jgi:hypothetical protein
MATPTTLPASFVAAQVLTAAEMNDLRGAFRVLQVVSTTKDDVFSSSSTSLTDVTGLSAVITPSATSSKVLVVVTCQISHSSSVAVTQCTITDSANAILIPAVSPGSRTVGFNNASTSGVGMTPAVFSLLHSPNTTSSFTYKIRARTNTGTFLINRDNTDADNANSVRSSSVITLMEISA